MGIEERTVDVFARAAATYGRVGPDLFGHFGSRVIRLLALTPDCSVLDVACGAGAVLHEATAVLGPNGRAIGVDLTPAMVAQAKEGLTKPKVAVMDAHALGLASGTFDVVVSNFAFTYFAQPRQVLEECRRVLRPEGRFGLVLHDGWWWHDDPRWAWHGQLLAEFGNSHATTTRRFSDPNTVCAVVEQAGFANTGVAVEPFDLRWADADSWWKWCWSHGYRVVLEAFDTARLHAFRSACFSHLGPGPIEGELPVIVVIADRAAERGSDDFEFGVRSLPRPAL